MNFLYRLSIRKRMSLILMAFLFPIVVVTYHLYGKLQEDITVASMEIEGIVYTKPLINLLSEVSKYQINTILAKSGNNAAEKKLPADSQNIDKIIADLIEINSRIGESLQTDKTEITPASLKTKWEKIKSNPMLKDDYESFMKDNLALLAYITDKSTLILDPDLDTYYMMDTASIQLPAILSEISKLKYMLTTKLQENGNQIIQSDKASVSLELELIRYVYLPKVINSIKTALENDPASNGTSSSLAPSMNEKLPIYTSNIEKLAGSVDGLLNGETITANSFVEIADLSQNASAELAQLSLIELEKMLNMRIDSLQNNLYNILGICALSVLIAFALFYIVSKSIVNPIIRLQGVMDSMIKGNLEITVPGQEYKDETGAMARHVESFRQNGIEKKKLEVENLEKDIRTKEEKQNAMRDMASSFESRMKGIIQAVAAASTELYHTSESMTHLTSEACRKVSGVKETSEQTSQNVNTVASAAEEMAASIREVAQQVLKSSSAVKSSVSEVEKADTTSGMLQESAEKIGTVVELIRDISEQINLLALNATIESARAGEAGKGFAVVASEVKNLANQASKATEEIAQYVENIQSVSTNVLGGLRSIKDSISDVEQFSTAISAAVEEQSASTKEIAMGMSNAADGSMQIMRDISDVNKASSEAGVAADQVLQAARMLSIESEKLNSEVEQFISELRNG